MKCKAYACLILLLFPVYLQAKPAVTLQRSHDGYQLEYTVPEWRVDYVDRQDRVRDADFRGDVYTRIRIPDFKYLDDIGKPELPVLVFYMAISVPDKIPTFELVNKVEEHLTLTNKFYPAQIPWAKSRPISERPFSLDTDYYNSDGERAPFAQVDKVVDIRGVPVVRVEIAPFYYNPRLNKVTVIKQFALKIKTSTARKYIGLDSKSFEKYLKHVLVNFNDAVEPVYDRRQNEDYLIITAPSYESDLADFVSFRQNRFNVSLVTTTTTGTSTSQIESYIRGLSPLPSFILLVGETGDIPMKPGSASGTPMTDLYYSCKDNNDYYPDMFLGRFSIANSTQLDNVIYKTMYMETNMGTVDKVGVFVGGVDAGNGHIAEATHNYVINTHFSPDGYDCKKIYMNSGQGSETEYKGYVNNGVIWNFYSGHGSQSSWAVGAGSFSSLSASDVQGMTNTTSFPYSYAFACYTGSMTTSECITEAWVRTNKHGAVTHIGSSVTSYWGGDDDMERGIVDAVYDNNNPVTSIAGSMSAGKLDVGSSQQRYHEMYNLMGDPALDAFPVVTDLFIEVTAPNGGEEWEQFTAQTVTWGDNIDGNVKIELFKGGSLAEVLAGSTESDGSFDWDVPADFTPGTDYKVKISSVDSSALFDESDANFTIIEEYIIDAFPYREDFDALADTGVGAPLPEKWEQLSGDDFDWTVFEGPTPSNVGSSPGATGPSADHTTGNDKYIYVEASSPNNPDKKADFITPKFNFKTLAKPQLYFWCHMLSDSNTMGDLYLDINVDGTWHNDVVHLTDDHGDKWFADTVDLSSYKGDRVRFRFRGITGDLWASDIALDDIIITAAPEFTSSPVTAGKVGTAYSYAVTASDEDDNGSGLSFGSSNLPAWLTLTDNANGTATLSGTPASGNAGDNPVVLTLSDGYIPDPVRQLFTINVVGIQPPQITGHPSDTTVTEGDPAEFGVTATGDAPLSYQWQKDQQDIAGAVETTYKIDTTVMADNGGKYRCVVSNSGGSVNSNEATLTVNLKVPVVTADPQDIMVLETETATFSVSAIGSALSYQWQKDQQDITGAVEATYTTPATTVLDNNKKFRCVISNSAGSVTSNEATLTVNLKVPVVTADPQDITVREKETATFSVSAIGSALSYQWQKDQQDITGAVEVTYTTPPTTMLDNNKNFRCVISNTAGSVTSGEAKLTVLAETSTLDPITDNNVTSADLVITPNPADEYSGGIRFDLNVREVTSAELTVYDPLGNKLWETEFSGQVKWDMRNTGGTRVAGGTCLVVVRLTYGDGSVGQIVKTFGIQVE